MNALIHIAYNRVIIQHVSNRSIINTSTTSFYAFY